MALAGRAGAARRARRPLPAFQRLIAVATAATASLGLLLVLLVAPSMRGLRGPAAAHTDDRPQDASHADIHGANSDQASQNGWLTGVSPNGGWCPRNGGAAVLGRFSQ